MAAPGMEQDGRMQRVGGVSAIRGLRSAAVAAFALTCLVSPDAPAQSIADRAARDQVAVLPTGDPDMASAMAQARADLAGFLALAERPRPGQRAFAVKVGFVTRDGTTREYIWLTPFSRREDGFLGRVGNRPDAVPDLQEGQMVRFGAAEIVDWMFIDATGQMRGNRTTCVLLARESAGAVAEFRRRFGLDCGRNGL